MSVIPGLVYAGLRAAFPRVATAITFLYNCPMRNYNQHGAEESVRLPALSSIVRAVGAIVGFVIIGIGISYVTRIFGHVLDALREPDQVRPVFEAWAAMLGGDSLHITTPDFSFPLSPVLAVICLAGGVVILVWIGSMIIQAGGKIVALAIGDADAVKAILKRTFGRSPPTIPPRGT